MLRRTSPLGRRAAKKLASTPSDSTIAMHRYRAQTGPSSTKPAVRSQKFTRSSQRTAPAATGTSREIPAVKRFILLPHHSAHIGAVVYRADARSFVFMPSTARRSGRRGDRIYCTLPPAKLQGGP